MFASIKKAGLTVSEFAYLLDVSRVAVYNWKAGRTKPHKLLRKQIATWEVLLSSLVAKKILPLADELTTGERKEKLAKLRKATKQLTP